MIAWNEFVSDNYRSCCDRDIGEACLRFATARGFWLLKNGLKANFLLHLVNLVNFGVMGESFFFFSYDQFFIL